MKKTLKLAFAALAIAITALACDPAKKTTTDGIDSAAVTDSSKKDTFAKADTAKTDTIKKDSVKK